MGIRAVSVYYLTIDIWLYKNKTYQKDNYFWEKVNYIKRLLYNQKNTIIIIIIIIIKNTVILNNLVINNSVNNDNLIKGQLLKPISIIVIANGLSVRGMY